MSEMTAATKGRLTSELEHLIEVDLPRAKDEVTRAQSAGDIAENPDVRLALAEVARIEARVRKIREALTLSVVVDSAEAGVVATGVVVALRFEGGEVETFLFGSVEDRHDRYDVLSADSPIGQAVWGKRMGDVIELNLGGRPSQVEIVALGNE